MSTTRVRKRTHKRSTGVRKRGTARKRSSKESSRKGWDTRRRRERATKAARVFYEQYQAGPDYGIGPDRPVYDWDRDEGWEPEGGWQGDELADEIAFYTHEEKVEFLEWLAEELDTTISDLFELLGSP